MGQANLLYHRYPCIATLDADDGWYIHAVDLAGSSSAAETREEIGPMARRSLELSIAAALEQGDPIPEPMIGGESPWPAGALRGTPT